MSEAKKDESDLSVLLYAEQLIKNELKGFHLEIMFYPSGGMIDATGCEECGTDDCKMESVSWKTHKDENMLTAIQKLKVKLGV